MTKPRRTCRAAIIERETGATLSSGIWPIWRFEEGALVHADNRLWRVVMVGQPTEARPAWLVWVELVK